MQFKSIITNRCDGCFEHRTTNFTLETMYMLYYIGDIAPICKKCYYNKTAAAM